MLPLWPGFNLERTTMNPTIQAMKSSSAPIIKGALPIHCTSQFAPLARPVEAAAPVVIPRDFRRLKFNEVVSRGDYVLNQTRGLEPWEGPTGFRAGSFIKLIYRRIRGRPMAIKSCP